MVQKYDVIFEKVIIKGITLELIESGCTHEYLATQMAKKLEKLLNDSLHLLECEKAEVACIEGLRTNFKLKETSKKAFMSYAVSDFCGNKKLKYMSCLVILDTKERIGLGESYIFQETIDIAQQYIKDHPEYEWVKTFEDLKLKD
jgi:hypothetical protein